MFFELDIILQGEVFDFLVFGQRVDDGLELFVLNEIQTVCFVHIRKMK
jgi:hypothetical protein